MSETLSIVIFLSTLFLLLGLGVWVGAALLATAIVGMALFTSAPIGDSMAVTIWGEQSSWTLTALPLFIWMGEILYRTKLSETLFRGLAPFLKGLPGSPAARQYRRHRRCSRRSPGRRRPRSRRSARCRSRNSAAGIIPSA